MIKPHIKDTSNSEQMIPFYNVILKCTLIFIINLFIFNPYILLVSILLVYLSINRYRKLVQNIEVDSIEYNLRYKDYVENIIKEESVYLGRSYKYNNSHITNYGEDTKNIYNIYINYGKSYKTKLNRQVHEDVKTWFYNTRRKIKTNEYRYRVFVNGQPISLKRN